LGLHQTPFLLRMSNAGGAAKQGLKAYVATPHRAVTLVLVAVAAEAVDGKGKIK